MIAYLVRFRLTKRIEDLRRARLTGNLAEFIATAEARIPGLRRAQAITLGRLLLEEELKALQALAEGQPAPCLGDLRSGASHFQSGQQEFPPSGLCAGR